MTQTHVGPGPIARGGGLRRSDGPGLTSGGRQLAGRISARSIQVGLGILWLLDGLLQLQPKMFGPDFAHEVILPAAQSQPGLVANGITHVANLVEMQPALANSVFAAVQMVIGVGLLIKKTVRPALVLSFVWAVGVWALGEGFGLLLTGAASPLTGAPGAALLYVAVGVLVWPRAGRAESEPPMLSGPASAQGPLGTQGGKVVWAVTWGGMGLLWLLPANRTGGGISAAIRGVVDGEPGWLASLQLSAAHAIGNGGGGIAVACAVASFVIALGPVLLRRATAFLVAGASLAFAYWVFGQAFGEPFSGIATDPNTGPLLVLLALTLYPNRVPGGAATGNDPARSVRPVCTASIPSGAP